ncbi:hypothetical protein AU476_01220 [Cupriavidus sp. UYMSc13B]|nr:hypothetical protein AU476_01220 [Cupriavidus sp. UYMSc13B]
MYATFRRKCPARLGDFRALRPESHLCNLDLIYETQLQQLLAGSPHLIVNTPDGADAVLKKWFDVTLSHTEASNINFRFVYLMSDRPDGLELLPQLAESFQFLYRCAIFTSVLSGDSRRSISNTWMVSKSSSISPR